MKLDISGGHPKPVSLHFAIISRRKIESLRSLSVVKCRFYTLKFINKQPQTKFNGNPLVFFMKPEKIF